jgi:hypothetical protein
MGAVMIKDLLRRLLRLLPDFRDVHVYGGGLLIAIGMWTWWRPGGFIVFGCLLVYLGLFRFRRT